MDSPHIVFARWIESLISEHKEAIQNKENQAAKEIRISFFSNEDNDEIFHVTELAPQLEPVEK